MEKMKIVHTKFDVFNKRFIFYHVTFLIVTFFEDDDYSTQKHIYI